MSRSSAAMAAPKEYFALTVALAKVEGCVPCRGRDEWHGDEPTTRARAADACWDCPLIRTCAAYADAANECHGVWGGQDRTRRTTTTTTWSPR